MKATHDSSADAQLVRAIGPFSLAANAVNITIGAGIFALPALVAAQLGGAAFLAYLICSLALGLILLCIAEAGSRVGKSGGVYAYIETAFGPLIGFAAAMIFCFGYAMPSDAAVANVVVASLSQVWAPAANGFVRAALLLVLFGFFATINVLGIRDGLRVVVALTIVKLLPLIAIILVGAFATHAPAPPLVWPSLPLLGQASLLLFFAFPGSETALTPSGEVREPARTVPRAILACVLVVLAIYLGVQFVAQSVLGDRLPLESQAPLAAVAGVLWGPWGKLLLLATASLSGLGVISGGLLANPRSLFAPAEDGLLPSALARVHPRFHTPYVAIVTYAALTLLVSISGGFAPLATLASASILLLYFGVCVALLKLRHDGVTQCGKPFVVPGGPLVPLLAMTVVLGLLSQTPAQQFGGVAALIAIAVILYFGRSMLRRPSTAT